MNLAQSAENNFGTYAGMLTALFTLMTAIGGVIVARQAKQSKKELRETKDQVNQVHVIVNQQRTDMVRRTIVLENFILAQGLELPEDQSKLTD